jgi:ABC-type multidrug transport system ATPase subunit
MALTNTLEFDSLYLEFGLHKVLQDVYVRCQQGEVVGLLGRNGSGKSCLMKIVFGSMKAYQQSVRINGNYVLNTNIKKRFIQYLPQASFIPPFLTVQTVCAQFQVSTQSLVAFAPELQTQLHSQITELSGGEIRLLEIFLILKSNGLFCILDEPFSFLSPMAIERVIALINEEKAVKGILLTDHLYKSLLAVSDTIYLLNNGKTHLIKDAAELIQFGYLPNRI